MKRLYAIILLIICSLITIEAQTGKKTGGKEKVKTSAKADKTKPPEGKQNEEILRIPLNTAQIEELESQRKDVLREIDLTTQLLAETKTNASNSLNRLNLLTQQLTMRRRLVVLLEQEVITIELNIKSINNEIQILEKDLTKIKENYAKSMQTQQQEHKTSQYKMLLILSAEDLSQSYRRMRYLKEYSDWQKEEAGRIIMKQDDINKKKTNLEKSHREKLSLITQRTDESKIIAEEEAMQQREVSELNKKQKDLQNELQRKQKDAEELNIQVEKLIAEDIKNSEKNAPPAASKQPASKQTERKKEIIAEAAEQNETETEAKTEIKTETATEIKAETETKTEAKAEAKTEAKTVAETQPVPASKTETESEKAAPKGNYVLTESESSLSKNFASNKGRLPYPVAGDHTIVSRFGEHQHQALTYVKTNNNGIDIQTTAGTSACAVFKGVVTRVFIMTGFNYNVIIRHGDYLTVYSNISQVYVKAGDVVNARQEIGKIHTDSAKGSETILHFQIWKERTKLNPELWIK